MHETMSLPGFARLVEQMRTAQRDYFRTRRSDHLVESKALEAKVDRAVGEILEPGTSEEQRTSWRR